MEWLLGFILDIGKGIWTLLTKGVGTLFKWLADGFIHFIAGGAVSGVTKVLDSARTQATTLGVRGSSTTIGYTSGSSSSSSSSSSRSAPATNFMGQFI